MGGTDCVRNVLLGEGEVCTQRSGRQKYTGTKQGSGKRVSVLLGVYVSVWVFERLGVCLVIY